MKAIPSPLMVLTFKSTISQRKTKNSQTMSLTWMIHKTSAESVSEMIPVSLTHYSISVNVPVPSSTCTSTAVDHGYSRESKPCKVHFILFMYFTMASAISARNRGRRKLNITRKSTWFSILNLAWLLKKINLLTIKEKTKVKILFSFCPQRTTNMNWSKIMKRITCWFLSWDFPKWLSPKKIIVSELGSRFKSAMSYSSTWWLTVRFSANSSG